MLDFKELIKSFQNCPCGEKHECAISDVRAESGLVHKVGDILKEDGFPKKLLLVADENTLAAAYGIEESLHGFAVTKRIHKNLRVATMDEVRAIEKLIDEGIEGVLAVGTGSIHDPCRLACARKNVPLCLFATAPSMDGFASYSSPIVDNGFKITYPAKCPEIILADSKILADSPTPLKSAGFGDMIAKYIAIIDWQVSHLLTGESYCEKVCDLTRSAVEGLVKMADKVTQKDEETAVAIFEALLLTGIAMSFTKTSRPGSGTEHIQAHYWECKQLANGEIPNYHGTDVGVSTLLILKYYDELANRASVRAHKELCDWEKIYEVYGNMADAVRKLNTPDTVTDGLAPRTIEENWEKIREIVRSVPSYDECKAAMQKAGCALTIEEIGISESFLKESFAYHPYMRRRLSLKRVSHMIDL